MTLSTKGAPAKVTLNPQPSKSVLFSQEGLDNLQASLCNASSKDMKKIVNWVRVSAGRNAIPPYYREHMQATGRSLESLYNITHAEFDLEGKEKKREQRPVVWADAESLLDAVNEERGNTGPVFVEIMADGGQGFLKIAMTVLPEHYDPALDRAPSSDDEQEAVDGDWGSPPEEETFLRRRRNYC